MSGPKHIPPGSISTRLFKDMDEIAREAGFLPDHPVEKATYRAILGYYDFKEEVLCCRLKESGQLCKEGHKKGYVVKLVDDSLTIVGNSCATTKFGDGSQIQADATRLTNELERLDRVEKFGEYVGNKDSILSQLREWNEKTSAVGDQMRAMLGALGKKTVARLKEMAKTGNGAVSATAVSTRLRRDNKGNEETETIRTAIRLGTFAAVRFFDLDYPDSISRGRLRIEAAFTKAKKLASNPRSVELKEVNAILGDYPRVIEQANELLRLVDQFNANDFSLLCYLESDKAERQAAAEYVVRREDPGADRHRARAWLAQLDEQLKMANGATDIKIGLVASDIRGSGF